MRSSHRLASIIRIPQFFPSCLIVLALMTFASCGNDATEPTKETAPTVKLECEEVGYPCSLADTPADRIVVALALLDDALTQRETGTMVETLAWLEAQPEVISAVGSETAIRFLIEDCVPIWLTDLSGTVGAKQAQAEAPQGIVGEDSNEDGNIDNRDDKRALVMAPYYWQFQPNDESDLLAGQLESLRGYTGNITFKSNPQTADQNIGLNDYLHWNEYDLIYLSTHGQRLTNVLGTKSWIVISSGIRWDFVEHPNFAVPGISLMGSHTGDQSNRIVRLGFSADFFRAIYPEGLDQSIVMLSACETGLTAGTDLAAAMGQEDFVMFGWSESVKASSAFAAMSLLMEKLGEGLTTQQALDAVDQAGLRSVLNSSMITTTLQRFSPDGGDQRLFELPQLLDFSADPLEDGVNLTYRVIGQIGDSNNDSLFLTVEVDGITAADRDAFTLSYRFAGNDLPGVYDLSEATETGNYKYQTNHIVALGQNLQESTLVPLEVVVNLPEGGQSRFAVKVNIDASGGSELNECLAYQPTPSDGQNAGAWNNNSGSGSAGLGTPSDPGGGFWTVSANCEDPVNILMSISSGGGAGSIFTESMQGTTQPNSITVAFEAAPGAGYLAKFEQAVVAPNEDYPINWSANWRYTSVVDCYEPNQNASQAKQLPSNIEGVSAYMMGGHRNNQLFSQDYDDWYKLVITEPSVITVNLKKSPSDIRMRMRLWNSGLGQVATAGSNFPGGLATFTYEAEPGVYFLTAEAAALGVGAVNKFFDTLPNHFVSTYSFDVTTEPMP